MIARLLPLLAVLLSAPVAAESPLQGSWALEAGGTAVFRFDLAQDSQGKWQATWSKPTSFASDGNNFSHMTGPVKKVASMTTVETADGIEISFDDPRPGAVPDIFDFKPIDADAVEMVYVGTKLAPYTLDRVKPGAALGPWDPTATYSREAPPASKQDEPAAAPEPITPETFKLKPGAPVGR